MTPHLCVALLVLASCYSPIPATSEGKYGTIKFKPSSSPFESALKSLQKTLNYSFQNVNLLRRAVTHPSFSGENNKALGVLGVNVIDAYVALISLGKNIDISSKELNRKIAEISKMEASCAVDGMRLGLHNVVRIASKANSTAPAVVCGAFRALFGAIAVDSGKSDGAGAIFWRVHTGEIQNPLVFSV